MDMSARAAWLAVGFFFANEQRDLLGKKVPGLQDLAGGQYQQAALQHPNSRMEEQSC